MREETELVSWRKVKAGMEVSAYKNDNGYKAMYPPFTITAITGAYVEISKGYHKEETERLSTENLFFEVEIPEERLRENYRESAKKIQKALRNKLYRDEIGQHEMWNGWICVADIYELAQTMNDETFTIIGVCYDITPHDLGALHVSWDVAVVIEYPDGERYWCHFASEYLNDFLEEKL